MPHKDPKTVAMLLELPMGTEHPQATGKQEAK